LNSSISSMLTDSQIRSFLIPAQVWEEGVQSRPDLPPIAMPARDALDIERRAKKRVNLRNELHRYSICCERIQGITAELVMEKNVLPAPLIFSRSNFNDKQLSTARSYLALIDVLSRGQNQNLPYKRMASIFFPPDHAKLHLKFYEMISKSLKINELFAIAAESASLPNEHFQITAEQCRMAFDQRQDHLRKAAQTGNAVVDIIELV